MKVLKLHSSKKNIYSLIKKNSSRHIVKKEEDYDKIINTFLMTTYMAMSSMNNIDEEYELFKKNEEKKKRRHSLPKKKLKVSIQTTMQSLLQSGFHSRASTKNANESPSIKVHRFNGKKFLEPKILIYESNYMQ